MLRNSILLSLLLISASASAKTSMLMKNDLDKGKIKSAKIVFVGDINGDKIAEMMAGIDDINNNYPAVKEISLYINSFGGDMEAGYMGAESVRGSGTPIKTINAGMTGSAATLIYCAAKRRETLASASFLIHPAASENIQSNYLKKNEVRLLSRDLDNASQIFRDSYADCIKDHDPQIASALLSEDNRLYLRVPDSITYGIAQKRVEGILPADIAYYITS